MIARRSLGLSRVMVMLIGMLLIHGCGKPSLESIDIELPADSVTVGQTLQLRAVGRDAQGNTLEDITWSWSVEGEAGQIDQQGLFTAMTPGSAQVVVTSGDKQARASLTVERQTATNLEVTVASPSVTVGESVQVAVKATNAAGQGLADVRIEASASTPGTVVQPADTTTSSSGEAHFTVTTGTTSGDNQVQFRGDGQEATASITAVAGAPAAVQVTAAAQETTAGQDVNVQVTVRDQAGNPIPGTEVAFSAATEGTTVSPPQATTNAAGQAVAVVHTSSKSGSNRVNVAVAPLETQVLDINGMAGSPARLTLQADSLETVAGGAVTITALVTDAHGNAVASTPVQVEVAPADAQLQTTSLTTDSAGEVRMLLHTSVTPGDNDIQARVADVTPAHLVIIGNPPVALHVTPQMATVEMRASQRFEAHVVDADGHKTEVVPQWKIVGDTGSIDVEGTYTAMQPGSDVVLALYGDLNAGAQLTVVPGQVATLAVTPAAATVRSGTTLQFQVSAANAAGYRLEVAPTWTTVGEMGTIDTAGLFTATRVGSGEIVVTVDSLSARAPVTVTPGELSAIIGQPHDIAVQAGEELQLRATGRDAAGNTVDITPTWQLTANLGEIDATGVFRARHAGEGHILVEAGDPPISAGIPVKVVAAPMARIAVEPHALTVSAGDEVQLTATGYDAFDNPIEITPQWQVSAEVGTVSPEGRFVAQQVGTAKIQASTDTFVGEASVVVKPGALATLSIEPTGPLSLSAGDMVTLAAVGHDAFGNVVPLTPLWHQTEPRGTLGSEGMFRAETVGTTVLQVRSGDHTASVTVHITPGKLASIRITPADVTMQAGETLSFTATGYDAYENEVSIAASWRVANDIGTIDAAGSFQAFQAQTGHIVATAQNISGETQVIVQPGPLSHLEVTPHRVELTAGDTAQITVVGYDVYGNPVSTQPVWQVTEGMGVLTADGLLTAQKAGEGHIVAAVHHLAVVVDLHVKRGDLASLRITPDATRLASGAQQPFAVEGFDLGGNPLTVQPQWEVRGEVGTIAPGGTFTGTVAGTGQVVALVGDLQAEAKVVVIPGEVVSLSLSPESLSLVAGESHQLHIEAFDAAGNQVSVSPAWHIEYDLGSVSDDGVFQARRAGRGSVIATSNNVQQSIAVEVRAGALAMVEVLPASLVITAGGKLTFTAAGYDAYGNAVAINPHWSLTGRIGHIDPQQGTFQATTVGAGVIVATVDTIAGVAEVTVEPGAVSRLELAPKVLKLAAGEEASFRLTAFDAHGNLTPSTATWHLTAALGELTEGRVRGQRAGTAEVVATVGDLLARSRLHIRPGPLVSLQVTPKRAELPSGETQVFRVVGSDAFGNAQVLDTAVWQLEGDIGRLDATGSFTAGRRGAGRITVRADALENQAEIRVVPGTAQRVMITPARAHVAATTVQEFTATGLDAGGNTVPIAVNWALTEGIGSIDQQGRFNARQVGLGSIVAYGQGLSATAEVRVTPGPVALLFVTPQGPAVPAGETLQFEVQGYDANHNAVGAVAPHWTVAGDVGSINTITGMFIAERQGWGKVWASLNGVQGSADVSVGHGVPDAQHSRMVASRVELLADSKMTADILVVVRDKYGNPVPASKVTLISSRDDHIDQPLPSNQQGVAVGRIRSNSPGQSDINAVVATGRISNTLRLTFTQPQTSG